MKIYPPEGAVGRPARSLAPSPQLLNGLRIGVLDNGKPNARELMVRAADQLGSRTGARLALVTEKGPGHNAATACSDAVLDRLAEEVDVVVTGSAD